MGRLSNPRETVDNLADQAWSTQPPPAGRGADSREPRQSSSAGVLPEETGRLSNPVQRRLSDQDIGAMVELYRVGASIDALARRNRVHRTTVIQHLDTAGVQRRRTARKMSDAAVATAARRYVQGESLAALGRHFGVHARTVTREIRRFGVAIRQRRA
jgi:transposase-like protein